MSEDIYEYIGIQFLHWLTDCDPASPTMAVYQYKVQESGVVQLTKPDTSADLQYVRIPKKWAPVLGREWTCQTVRASGHEKDFLLLPCPYTGCQ